MISLQLRKRRKMIAAGLALLALPAMIYLFNSFQRNTLMFAEALDLKKRNLAKYRQKVLEKNVVAKELSSLQHTFKRAEAALLTGKTVSLAAAEIQQIVTSIADAAGAQITAVRILQPDRNGKEIYVAIPVEVTINSTMRQLSQVLYKLDRSAKLLRIAKLGIQSRARRIRGARSENIVTNLTIEGFVKKMET
jgi:hypothetical protein